MTTIATNQTTGKHTPGPWEVEEGDTIVPAGGGGCVAHASGDSQAQQEANARLIAAAPDLLEAALLRKALTDANAHDADTRWKTLYKMERAAIAKAGGVL